MRKIIIILAVLIMAPISWHFGGDQEKAKGHAGIALNRLTVLKQKMSLGKLKQGFSDWYRQMDGSVFRVSSVHGMDKIEIFSPFIPVVAEDQKGEATFDRLLVVGFINYQSDTNGVAIFFDDNLEQLKEIVVPSRDMSWPNFTGPQTVVCDPKSGKGFNADTYDYIHKYDMKKMELDATLQVSDWDWTALQVTNTVMGDEYFYVGVQNNPGVLRRIDTKTFTVAGTYNLDGIAQPPYYSDPWYDQVATVIPTPNGIITNGTNGVLEWLNSDLSLKGRITLPDVSAGIHVPSSTYSKKTKRAYVFQQTNPTAKVIGIDTETGLVVAQSQGFSDQLTAATTDLKGNVYYGVGNMTPDVADYVIKFDTDLNLVATSPQLGTYQFIASVASSTDGKFLYAVTYRGDGGDGFTIHKLKTSDLSIVKSVMVQNRYALGMDLCPLPE